MAPAASTRTRKKVPKDPAADTCRVSTLAPIEAWFAQQGWQPQPFQKQCWQAYLEGRSGLIQVPTGSGKTYAAVMGPLAELVQETNLHHAEPAGLRLLVITPLRALSRDLQLAIETPITAMGWPVRVDPPAQTASSDPDHHPGIAGVAAGLPRCRGVVCSAARGGDR
jgi:ATP-dependent helicase YprA (DUF1998 family)